jgi:hypothetical protein
MSPPAAAIIKTCKQLAAYRMPILPNFGQNPQMDAVGWRPGRIAANIGEHGSTATEKPRPSSSRSLYS